MLSFSFGQKETSSCAPRLFCDAHQAFANLYQVCQSGKQEKLEDMLQKCGPDPN